MATEQPRKRSPTRNDGKAHTIRTDLTEREYAAVFETISAITKRDNVDITVAQLIRKGLRGVAAKYGVKWPP